MEKIKMLEIYKNERVKTFMIMWFIYAGYYLIRKNYAVALPVFMKEYGWTTIDVGIILTANFVAYAIGQFVNGFLGDKFGSRTMIFFGLILSIFANILFPLYASVSYMIVVWGVCGYAQSTGWPNSIKVMASWFSVRERGTVLGFWCTSYQVGGVMANILASFFLTYLGWKYSFWGPTLIVAIILLVFMLWQSEKPEDKKLPTIEEYQKLKTADRSYNSDGDCGDRGNSYESREAAPSELATKTVNRIAMPALSRRRADSNGRKQFRALSRMEILMATFKNTTVLAYGFSYFFLKFIRYSLLYWMPLYMVDRFGYNPAKAGVASTALEIGGFLGAIFAGWISDKYLDSRRAPVAAPMLIGMAIAALVYSKFAGLSMIHNLSLMALLGFMMSGPDTIISGSAAVDAVPIEAAATASGMVNGMGSLGQSLAGVLIGIVVSKFGWQNVFYLFFVLSIIASAIAASQWNVIPKSVSQLAASNEDATSSASSTSISDPSASLSN